MWRANGEACVTRQFFTEWIHKVPATSEKKKEPGGEKFSAQCPSSNGQCSCSPSKPGRRIGSEYNFLQVKFFLP